MTGVAGRVWVRLQETIADPGTTSCRAIGAVVVTATMSALAACGEPSSGDAPVAAEATEPAGNPLGLRSDPASPSRNYPGATVIAWGEVEGAVWQLLLRPPDQTGATLCLELESLDGGGLSCSSGGLGLGLTPAERTIDASAASSGGLALVYGRIAPEVTRVAVTLASGEEVEGEIVGDARAHFLARTHTGAVPTQVVAYGADGGELARRDLVDGATRPSDPLSSCAPTEATLECGEGVEVEQSCEPVGDDGEVRCTYRAEPDPDG